MFTRVENKDRQKFIKKEIKCWMSGGNYISVNE